MKKQRNTTKNLQIVKGHKLGYRFRRRIKIAPGLSLNVGKKGVSLSAGVRGASITVGKRGVYQNIGIPGTGISYRSKIGGSGHRSSSAGRYEPLPSTASIKLSFDSEGKLLISDLNGNGFSPKMLKNIKLSSKDTIDSFLKNSCNACNQQLKDILLIQNQTPDPQQSIRYSIIIFEEPTPLNPRLKSTGFLGLLSKKHKRKIESINADLTSAYQHSFDDWSEKEKAHNIEQERLQRLYDSPRDKDEIEECLEHRISSVNWPLATEISCEISDNASAAWLDVDLPEIENMPNEIATISTRPLGLNLKKIAETDMRKNYMMHAHGIIFRLVGETFATLPMIQTVSISGYSQRINKSTGETNDDYLISVQVLRSDWERINFLNLNHVDPCIALESFDLRRNMTKTGVFKTIDPFVRSN